MEEPYDAALKPYSGGITNGIPDAWKMKTCAIGFWAPFGHGGPTRMAACVLGRGFDTSLPSSGTTRHLIE